MSEHEVEILLATFNGELFLREQIDSLLAQDYDEFRILARDDGSRDGTLAILRDYAQRYPSRFRILSTALPSGQPKWSFLHLLKASRAKYVCLSDQDDVWLPTKVSLQKTAMSDLESEHGPQIPLLVFTDLRVVDENLRELHPSFWQEEGIRPQHIHKLQRLLGDNVLTGCTAMLNRRLVELSLRMPAEASMHDRWIALLASAMGKSRPLPEKTVLYRQHDRNTVGIRRADNSILGIVRRSQNLAPRLKEWKISQDHAAALLRLYRQELSSEKQELLQAYLSSGQSSSRVLRILNMIRYGFFRGGMLRNLARASDLWRLHVKE